LDKKKQYVQSMLQVEPLGLASKWKPGGAFAGKDSVIEAIFVSPSPLQKYNQVWAVGPKRVSVAHLDLLSLSIRYACCYLSSFLDIAQGSLLD